MCKQKPIELEGMKKGNPSIVRIRCYKILQKLGHEEYRGQRTSLNGRSSDLPKVTIGRKNTA
jgi:ribosomal protein S13